MKKITVVIAVLAVVMLMAGCKRSNIVIEDTAPAGVQNVIVVEPTTGAKVPSTTMATSAYTIPEGATGPGDVTLGADAYADYSDDKKPQETTDSIIQVRYFYINSKGLNEDFDVLENKDCNVENLTELMVGVGVLADGTEVVKFESDGSNGVLTLNKLEGQSSYATVEKLAQALANTYTDNLYLDTLTIIADGETYGPLEYQKLKK